MRIYFPWGRGAPGKRDPYWRAVFWLVIVLAVVITLIAVYALVSSMLGCGTVPDCIDRVGLGTILSRMPWLGVLCGVFVVIVLVLLFMGMMGWRLLREMDGEYKEKHVRKRPPPE